ncbi:maleylpyruvate isomerase family mycothiol-dependent enzyme [Planosporangium flavigriseum]|uniref:Maleylpyruvate isomerase n=1 Tax=Planosporangium flavigriseum TaxID=373681 RepID=A0A8J3LI13_9ACTN|nr:maleylpyruvate isomerase family mycothiol-dependent enzyme [Planosporangium flavigriseum]NJC65313.1 maleylpyruvate isomerase family mycothiol-dependent enzyme [Planosporangium flavigriseum]GIG73332.1 maleylpyruvate isomerase [Planosporangium flavigriseum]
MTADPLVLLPEIDRATARLLETTRRLDDAAVTGGSLLPGWTRGHLLTHLARNADACVNLLTGARTGADTPAYPSDEHRTADIEAGARRPVAEQASDLAAAAERFDAAVAQLPPAAWTATVRWRGGHTRLAAYIPWARLSEVELHHVDLDAGYRPADWPDAFVHRLLHDLVADLAESMAPVRLHATDLEHELTIGTDPAVTVSGSGHGIAAWLSGRADGADLTVTPEGPLPTVPIWK